MLKWIAGRINCLKGQHVRNKRKARRVADRFESKCTYCGVKMVRLGRGNWTVK